MVPRIALAERAVRDALRHRDSARAAPNKADAAFYAEMMRAAVYRAALFYALALQRPVVNETRAALMKELGA